MMEELLDDLLDKAEEAGTPAIQTQIRFKGDGFTSAGALKRSPVAGVFELLVIGKDTRSREEKQMGVILYFEASEIQHIAVPFEASPITVVGGGV